MSLAHTAKPWGVLDSHPFKDKILESHPHWQVGSMSELCSRDDLGGLLIEPEQGIVDLPGRQSLSDYFQHKYQLSHPLSLAAISRFSHESNFIDSFEYRDKKYIPRSILADRGPLVLSRKFPNLDTSKIAFLTLGSPWVWGMTRVLVSLGYKHFCVLTDDGGASDQQFAKLSQYFRAQFFDLRFEMVPNSKIVLQKPQGSILLNLLSQEQMDESFNNLHFLNFLGKNAILVNVDVSAELGLLQEAHELGLVLLSFEDLFQQVISP